MELRSKLFYIYLTLLLIYSGFVLLPAPQPQTLLQYHLSPTGVRLIDLSIIVILAFIWYIGFYGYAKFASYARLIKKDKDGQQVAKLSKGILLLVMWLPLSSVTSSILQYYGVHHPSAIPSVTIVDNYVSLLLPLTGFIFISRGAYGLRQLVKRPLSYDSLQVLVIFLIYIGLIYYRLVATTQDRTLVYHMSIWLILLTLVAPYVYMWFIGLTAAYQIYDYQKHVAGIVYRKSWNLLAFGFGWLIITSIAFQYLTTLTTHLRNLSIYWLLALIYALLLVLSIGFVLITVGTRKLQRIEEV